MLRRFRSMSLAALTALTLGFGCQHTERPDTGTDPQDASPIQPDSARGPGFAAGACYTCVSGACGAPIEACKGEPSCASYLTCVGACPALAEGKVDPACVATCLPASGSTPEAAQAALDGCFTTAAKTCAACGGAAPDAATPDGGFKHPALRQQCPPSNESDACYRCQFENCCDSVDAISLGGPATDLSDCYLACKDAQCEKACFDRFPEGIPGFGGYSACLFVRCIASDVCPTRGNGCGLCQYRSCPEELAECETDIDCSMASQCTGNCDTDPACGASCRASYPKGAAKYDALAVCTAQHCIDVCGG